jgi:cytochrome c oxidase subunit 4
MSEFHDDYPQYEFMAHHSEEEGVKKRRTLWNVFFIMLAITIIELIIGLKAHSMGLLDPVNRTSSVPLKFIFIGLTLLKAYYIVFKFMHLGDEKKWMKYTIIGPYTVFIVYLICIIVGEANYSKEHKAKMDDLIVKQKIELNERANSGKTEEEPAPAAEGAKHE